MLRCRAPRQGLPPEEPSCPNHWKSTCSGRSEALGRTLRRRDSPQWQRDYKLTVRFRPVYPIAVRTPEFFANVHPLWFPYFMRDVFRVAEYPGVAVPMGESGSHRAVPG